MIGVSRGRQSFGGSSGERVACYDAAVSDCTFVILNPHSSAGRTGRRWPQLAPRLEAALGPLRVLTTGGPRDAERLVVEAARKGARRVVVAGGDGTMSEVVTGALDAGRGGERELGILPMGSGCDFARSLGLPRSLSPLLECLRAGRSRKVDAGRVHFTDRAGTPMQAAFLNVASFGISGLTDALVARAGKRLGPTLAFAIGTLRAIVQYRQRPVEIRVDGRLVHEGPLNLGTAANGRFFGSGMEVAPRARIDDGLLDVVVVGALSRPGLIARFPALYRGAHLQMKSVSHRQGSVVEVLAEPGEVMLDIDGEPLGYLPARFEVLPGAIHLFGVPEQPV